MIDDFDNQFVDEIMQTVETPIAILDGDGRFVRFNPACEAITGYSEEEVIGKKVWQFLIVDAEVEAVKAVFTATRAEDVPTHFTNYWKTKSGDQRLLQWSNKALRRSDGTVSAILATAQDRTEISVAEQSLSDTQAFSRSVIDASPVAIVTSNERGQILTFSRAAEEIFGYRESDVVNKNISVLIPEADRGSHDRFIDRYLKTGEARILDRGRRTMARRSNNEAFPVLLHVSEMKSDERIFVAFFEDLTEREATAQALEETKSQLRHADRIGSMGEIATSIAHELNQPLTAAASLVGAVTVHLNKGECAECKNSVPLLNDAVGEIRRASEIIQQMRDFVRKRKSVKNRQSVNKAVEDAGSLAIIGATADGIEVRWDLAPDTGDAYFDRIQIQQVVTNLIRNAIEAMQGMPERVLTISSRRNGDMIEVQFADTGPGLDETARKTLFEPFVTSKEDGMGVGLSISKTIIDAHQGKISATNRDSGGCVFMFKLPTGTNKDVGETS